MWALRGNHIQFLERVAMGSLRLDDESVLPKGSVRRLTPAEERALYADVDFSGAFYSTCIPAC